ncbi:hypothetical protein MRB53_039321 [Persea americana]|nr:hypothetical protein MRB53_039321 [Persea americana]
MVLHSFYWRYEGSNVSVTGDFDDWKGETKMQHTDDGHFVKVIDLPANTKIYYKFIVDGRWTIDGEALKEGEGQLENNYVLTGTAHQSATAIAPVSHNGSSMESTLPTLGAGASYVTPASAPAAEKTLGVTPEDVPEKGTADFTTPNAPAPAKHESIATSASAAAEADNVGESILDTTELKKKATEAAEVAGGVIAGGLAAGAAVLGLSGEANKKESKIPQKTIVQDGSGSATPVGSKVAQVSQSGSLEQAAVAAATVAATNAYSASGLSGLTGATAPVDSISKDGNIGFTGIGTAVNSETGVVGTSKIVQGIQDTSPVEDTQTAKLSRPATASLLENQANGAKVEKLGEHAVLAEVGIGGAAIGTAVVTDSTITSAKDLAIPSQAAEHLTSTSSALPAGASELASTSGLASASELAPALGRDVSAPVESAPSAVAASTVPSAVPAAEPVVVVPAPTVPSTAAPTISATVAPASAAPASKDSIVPVASSSAPVTAAKQSKAANAIETPTKTPTTPARAAAAAAAAGQSAHTPRHGANSSSAHSAAVPASPAKAPSEATSKDATTFAEDGKKKRGLFKRMKNMFNKDSAPKK